MYKSVVYVAHPGLQSSVANAALLKELTLHPDILVRNLYDIYGDASFNQTLDTKEDQAIIEVAEKVILQFPFYWYSATPLLKKWLDDTLLFGWAYGAESPKTKGKKLAVAITTGGGSNDYSPNGYNNYYLTDFLQPFIQTAKLCKMEFSGAFFVSGARKISKEELALKCKDYINFIHNV